LDIKMFFPIFVSVQNLVIPIDMPNDIMMYGYDSLIFIFKTGFSIDEEI